MMSLTPQELLNANGDWRARKFWLTHDNRFLSVNEMSTEHLINICRQIVNAGCREARIEPIAGAGTWAEILFEVSTPLSWVMLCKLFHNEITRRLALPRISRSTKDTALTLRQAQPPTGGTELSYGYRIALEAIEDRIARLSTKWLPTAKRLRA